MNIKFTYLYRDGANYKQYHTIVFPNPAGMPLEEIQKIITKNLIEETWFVAKDWNLPDLHFKEYIWDDNIDHDWHEFEDVEETTEDITMDSSIETFFERIKEGQQSFSLKVAIPYKVLCNV